MAKTLLLQGIKCQEQMWPCFCRGPTLTNLNDFDFASVGIRKINNGQDLASAGDQVPRTNVTLLLQGVNINKFKWLWLCFCRESKNKEWPRPCFCRGSSDKTNATLLLQGVNISTNLNDFLTRSCIRGSWNHFFF